VSSFPQSGGEFLAQELYGSRERAERFYRDQMVDVLTSQMVEFLAEQTEMVVSSVDTEGRPDASVRFGEPGFVAAIDERTVAWPELRGNGVMTTIGNLLKSPAAHLMFLDRAARIGLHLRGFARVLELGEVAEDYPQLATRSFAGRGPERWVVLHLSSAYIHCRKHFPKSDGVIEWGTDDPRAKGGDYFGAKDTPSPWAPNTTNT
jgi:predicted pyridoxine 5'-phosphate oxidase superfamily flavin-nucleotide-binding protein